MCPYTGVVYRNILMSCLLYARENTMLDEASHHCMYIVECYQSPQNGSLLRPLLWNHCRFIISSHQVTSSMRSNARSSLAQGQGSSKWKTYVNPVSYMKERGSGLNHQTRATKPRTPNPHKQYSTWCEKLGKREAARA